TIDPPGVFYGRVTVDIVPDIISSTILKGEVIKKLCYAEAGKKIPLLKDIPFYSKQKKIVLRNCGIIDPNSIDQYIARKGYDAFAKALFELEPEKIINEITKAGLRGRGGAGFPTGIKWGFCRKVKGDIKYIICNADEGDPGAFMDRAILEGDPHAVIERMRIAELAIGSEKGCVYVRAEYPIAVDHS
ncbi:MAG: NADH-quinone oxidoreductase subunit F, partial [Deltaproteobacteria bacterium]|nr:NADH-quinone oxidoreductase subunit F [Deltaproteobacteria bacterium]